MKQALIKISGNLVDDGPLTDTVIRVLKKIPTDRKITICWSGGKQVEEAIIRANGKHRVMEIGESGRILRTWKEQRCAMEALYGGRIKFKKLLEIAEIKATVVIPIVHIGGRRCLVNGDGYVLTAYNGFDEIIILTVMPLAQEKKDFFVKHDPLGKIEVLGVEVEMA